MQKHEVFFYLSKTLEFCYIAVGVRTFFKEVQVDIELMNVQITKNLLMDDQSHKVTNRGTPKFLTLKNIEHDRSNKLGLKKYRKKTTHHVCSS